LTEAEGGPIAIVVKAANMHDSLLLQDALEAVIVEPPDPKVHPQNLCLDKAFDGAPSEATAKVFGYEPHIRRIGEEKTDQRGRRRRNGSTLRRRAHDRVAQPLPRHPHPLREEGGRIISRPCSSHVRYCGIAGVTGLRLEMVSKSPDRIEIRQG